MLVIMLAISAGTSFWDRSAAHARRRARTVPLSLVCIKLAVIAVIGGAVVFVLNQNRGQSAVAVGGVPIVVPVVLDDPLVGTLRARPHQVRPLHLRDRRQRRGRTPLRRQGALDQVVGVRDLFERLAVFSALLSVPARVGSVDATVGRDIVLSSVAAAVVGGRRACSAARGRLDARGDRSRSSSRRSRNGLGLLNLPAGVNLLVTGGVLILAATVDALSRVRSGGGQGGRRQSIVEGAGRRIFARRPRRSVRRPPGRDALSFARRRAAPRSGPHDPGGHQAVARTTCAAASSNGTAASRRLEVELDRARAEGGRERARSRQPG